MLREKKLAIKEMRAKELQIAATIDELVIAGRIEVDDVPKNSWFCGMFQSRNRPRRIPASIKEQSAAEERVFGKRSQSLDASQRLTAAADSVLSYTDQTRSRASVLHEKARSLNASGKKSEALAALKRSKILEKQADQISATHAALERQVDMLAESELQREVANALNASVQSTKRASKGLLNKAENAVDGAQEIQDMAADLNETLGALHSTDYDDDELLEELNAMEEMSKEPFKDVKQVSNVEVELEDVSSPYPVAPSSRMQKVRLLDDDGASVGAMA